MTDTYPNFGASGAPLVIFSVEEITSAPNVFLVRLPVETIPVKRKDPEHELLAARGVLVVVLQPFPEAPVADPVGDGPGDAAIVLAEAVNGLVGRAEIVVVDPGLERLRGHVLE